VERWITVNEPLVVTHLGYRTGIHAPGLADEAAAAAATHHLLLGHGLATAALRAAAPGAQVGITLNLTPVLVEPQANGAADLLERARLVADATHNGVFLEPLLHGRYPEHAPAAILPPAELIRDGDMAAICAPFDFLGVNYYRPQHLRAGDPANLRLREFRPVPGIEGGVVEYYPEEMELTNMDWLIDPDGLYQLLLRLAADAPGLPLYITENGRAAEDYLNPAGQVDDRERVKYLHQHLDACARAARDGVNLRGYYVWSLLDNFEWAYGYQKRFGIVYVDFPTGRRTPKASAAFYSRVARENAVPPLPIAWPT
jgi:beta-glucosidase